MARKRQRDFGAVVQSSAKPLDKTVNVLAWGPPGSGKTTLIGTAPKPFVLAAEKGMLTLADKDIPFIWLDPEYEIYDTVINVLNKARRKEKILDG